MDAQPVVSAKAVINALGGTAAVAKLTGAPQQAVTNWKRRNKLPATTVMVLRTELQRIGIDAPLALWGVTAPVRAS